MTMYRINWTKIEKGWSYVDASSEEEAKKMAEQNEDMDFESQADATGNPARWEVESIEREEI